MKITKTYRGRIGRRLVVSFSALVIGVVGGCGWVLYHLIQTQLENQMSAHLMRVAQLAASGINGEVVLELRPEYSLYKRLQLQLIKVRDLAGASRIYVFNRQGHSLLDTQADATIGRPYPRLAFDKSELENVWTGNPAHSVRFQDEQGVDYKMGYAPIHVGNQVVAGLGVEIGVGFLEAIRAFKKSVFVLGIISALLTGIVAIVLGKSLTGPIHRLVMAAREIGQGHLSQPVVSVSRDELGYLAQTLDDMRRQLHARDEQLHQMLAGVAHEIRNPLGGIELYAGLIAVDLEETDPRKAHILKVIGEVRTLNQVITDFLTYARPAPVMPEPVALAQLVGDVAFLMAPEMEQAHVVFQEDIATDWMIYVDAGQIKRALVNLVKNAIQAMPQGGHLIVSARREKPWIIVGITDTGKGMLNDQMERIFEPFYTTKEQGSGLGLAIVKQAVEENRGEIFVESTIGKGTVVWLRLPEWHEEKKA